MAVDKKQGPKSKLTVLYQRLSDTEVRDRLISSFYVDTPGSDPLNNSKSDRQIDVLGGRSQALSE